MTDVRSTAANTQNDNVISGKVHEFVTRPSVVRVAAAASAVGMRMTVLIGGRSLGQDQELSAANRFPILPDDLVTEGGANAGDRIVVSTRNTTGGAITANVKVDVIPVR
jgi:hypothetical protein